MASSEAIVGTTFVLVFSAIALSLVVLGRRTGAGDEPLAQVRGRLVSSVGVFLIVLGLAMAADAVWFGVAFTVAAPLAAAAALLTFGVAPWREPVRGTVRTASLGHRTVVGLTGPVAALVPLLALLMTAGTTLACIPFSGADGQSFVRTTTEGLSVSTSAVTQFPGWRLGPLILLGLGVLTAACIVALRRVSLLPAVHPDEERDLLWRRRVARAVLAIASTGMFFELVMVLGPAGSALSLAKAEYPGGTWLVHALSDVVDVAAPVSLLAGLVSLAASSVLARQVGWGTGDLGTRTRSRR